MKKHSIFLFYTLLLIACQNTTSTLPSNTVDVDGQIIFCGKGSDTNRYDVYLIDLPSQKIKNLSGEYVDNIDNAFGHSIGCDTNLIPYKITGMEWAPSGELLILNAGGPFLTIPYIMNISPNGDVLSIVRQWPRSPLSISAFENPEEYSWSPNGREVAFVGVNSPEGFQNLFVANISNWQNGSDLSGISQITNLEQDWPGIIYSPAWSPNGGYIAVSINRHSSGVGILSKDGTSSVFITNDNYPELSNIENPTDPWINAKPSWFPDSKSLVFIGAISKRSRTALFSVNNDGADLRLLIPEGVSNPVVSPLGNYIAYIEYSDSELSTIGKIIRVDKDGENKKILATIKLDGVFDLRKHYIRDLSWSPDGRYLIFTSNKSGQFQLYLVTDDGSQFLQITNFNGDAVNPQWRPENHDNLP